MKKNKILSLIACGVLAASATLGLAACGDKDKGLTVWAPSMQQELVKELVADFLAENPDINLDIKVGVCGEDTAYADVSKDVEAGPDVFGYANDQLMNLKKSLAVARLGTAIVDGLKATDDIDALNAGKITENATEAYYGYPYAADNTFFMYYDSSIVSDEQAKTLEGVLEACKAKRKLFLFNMNKSGSSWYLGSFFYGAGGTYDIAWEGTTALEATTNFDQPVSEGSQYTIGQVAGKALIDLRANMYFQDADNSVISTKAIAGEIGAVITGTWNSKILKDNIQNLKATKLPTYHSDLTDEDYQLVPFVGYKLMGVNPNSKHIEEAHKLAQYLTSEKAQRKRFETLGIGPTNNTVAALDEVRNDMALSVIFTQQSFAKHLDCLPADYWTSFDAFGADVFGGLKFEDLSGKLATLISGIKNV